MHAVAPTEEDEERIREMAASRGHTITCFQPIAEMEERARRQFIELEEIGVHKAYRETDADRDTSPNTDEPELPF